MITTPNKRMDTASTHSYETVYASIATGGGDKAGLWGTLSPQITYIYILRLGEVSVIQRPMA